MSNTASVLVAWIAVFGAIAAYAVYLIVRGRRLGRQVPPDRRRWIQDR